MEFAHATRVPTSHRGLVKTKSASQDPTDRTAPLQDSETAKTQTSAPSGAHFSHVLGRPAITSRRVRYATGEDTLVTLTGVSCSEPTLSKDSTSGSILSASASFRLLRDVLSRDERIERRLGARSFRELAGCRHTGETATACGA